MDLRRDAWLVVQRQRVVVEVDQVEFIRRWARVSLLVFLDRVVDELRDLQPCSWTALAAYDDPDLVGCG